MYPTQYTGIRTVINSKARHHRDALTTGNYPDYYPPHADDEQFSSAIPRSRLGCLPPAPQRAGVSTDGGSRRAPCASQGCDPRDCTVFLDVRGRAGPRRGFVRPSHSHRSGLLDRDSSISRAVSYSSPILLHTRSSRFLRLIQFRDNRAVSDCLKPCALHSRAHTRGGNRSSGEIGPSGDHNYE